MVLFMQNEERYEIYNQEFEDLNQDFYDRIELSGDVLEKAHITQIELQLKYGRLYARVCSLLKESEHESDISYSEAFSAAVGDSYKDVSATEAKHKAQSDKAYYQDKTFENKVYRLKKELESIVDTIESRKYTLKDLTALVLAGAENHII
jgi:hypothetical protein